MRRGIEGLEKEREGVKIGCYSMEAHAKVDGEWGMMFKTGFGFDSESNKVIPHKGFYVGVVKMKSWVRT